MKNYKDYLVIFAVCFLSCLVTGWVGTFWVMTFQYIDFALGAGLGYTALCIVDDFLKSRFRFSMKDMFYAFMETKVMKRKSKEV